LSDLYIQVRLYVLFSGNTNLWFVVDFDILNLKKVYLAIMAVIVW